MAMFGCRKVSLESWRSRRDDIRKNVVKTRISSFNNLIHPVSQLGYLWLRTSDLPLCGQNYRRIIIRSPKVEFGRITLPAN
jgi:hypothetical protein